MKIGKLDFEGFMSTSALLNIQKECGGDVDTLETWLTDKNITTGEQLQRICRIITILANGYVFKHNKEVDRGLTTGVKLETWEYEDFECLLGIQDFQEAFEAVFGTIYEASDVVLPEGIQAKEKDEILEEIEEAKNR